MKDFAQKKKKGLFDYALNMTIFWGAFSILIFGGCRSIRFFDDVTNDEGEDSFSQNDSSDSNTDEELLCENTLKSRLSVTQIEVQDNIKYVERGYDHAWIYSRIVLDFGTDNNGYIAWANRDETSVFVTPITVDRKRDGEDIEITGVGLGGFVSTNDGFALLTRQLDEGDDPAVGDSDRPAKAVVWIRNFKNGNSIRTVLTGTRSVDGASDYNSVENFRGQLAWNNDMFAAYFEVRGGMDHPSAFYFGDKMVLINSYGESSLEWSFRCGTMRDADVIWKDDSFFATCISDNTPAPGLNLLLEDGNYTNISRELYTRGYVGGSMGGAVRMADGTYVTVWTSRRWNGTDASSAETTHDIALVRLTEDFQPVGLPKWITETPDCDETNLHIAPYGTDRILLTWNRVTDCNIRGETCFGKYDGTVMQLFTPDGMVLSNAESIFAPMTVASKPYVYPNGDLAWAFVDIEPNYTTSVNLSSQENKNTLSIAHLKYCDIAPFVL